MHDYVKGAFEALSWVKRLILSYKTKDRGFDELLREVETALEDIEHGVAIDFRRRLRPRSFTP